MKSTIHLKIVLGLKVHYLLFYLNHNNITTQPYTYCYLFFNVFSNSKVIYKLLLNTYIFNIQQLTLITILGT